jgi:hypothetical protein
MTEPTFYARDGEVYYRHGLWVPRESAERLLAIFRPHDRKLADELSAAMAEAYRADVAA